MGESRSSSPSRIAALVLAAGASTRMQALGEQKQLLRFGTRTLLDLALASVSLSEVDEIALVLGAGADAIQSKLWLDEAQIVLNPEWQRGMISSVRAGLRALGDGFDWIVMLPCDYALVERSTVALLLLRALHEDALARARNESPPPIIAPSFFGRSGHPIVLGREVIEPALNLPDGVGLDSVVQAFKPRRALVEVDDPAIHFDIDTPEDYQAALEAWNARAEHRDAFTRRLAR